MVSYDVNNYIFWSAIISLVIWFCACYFMFAIRRMPAYHPFSIYLIYHFLGYIYRPFSIYMTSWSFIWVRIGFNPAVEDIISVTLLSNIALLSSTFGVVMASRKFAIIPTLPPTRFIIRDEVPFFAICVILAAIGMYSTYRGYGTAGLDSVNAFQTAVDASGGQRLEDISGYTLALAEALPVLCVILLLSRVSRTIAYSATGAFVALRLYVGAQRLSFVVVLAAAILNSLIANRRRFPTVTLIAALLAGYVAFDMIGQDRYTIRRVVLGQASITEVFDTYFNQSNREYATNMDIVEYETATATVSIVDNFSGHSWGTQYLRVLVWPIPRQLWHDKPVNTNIVDLSSYGFNFLFLTHTLYADQYMAFGYAWVAIGMMLLGWFMGRLYEIAGKTKSPLVYAFFWIFLIYLKTVLRDGGVVFVYFWAFSTVFAYVLIKAGKLQLDRNYRDVPQFVVRTRRSREFPGARRSRAAKTRGTH